jgi:lipoyl synthase
LTVNWQRLVQAVEPLQDLDLDQDLVRTLELDGHRSAEYAVPPVHFYTPTFKSYQTSELKSCGKNAWPAVSVTGGDCKLQCDHCKAAILEPMIPARTPEALWRVVNEVIADGARGLLLTGGSNRRNEVEYAPFYQTIRRIKDSHPDFRIAAHAALMDADAALSLAQAGVDVAMMDVIGAQETITNVYHLRRSVDDFEATLENLVRSPMRVVPHIVIGLHYGRMLGEWRALEIIQRHLPDAVVLVVVMPFYAPEKKPFVTPNSAEVGRFFREARKALPGTPLLLGCARPPGESRMQIDTYAVMAGLDGIAHPADGAVELAARLGRRVRVTPACCSIVVGDEVMALDDGPGGLELDIDTILQEEARRRAGDRGIGIPVVSAPRPPTARALHDA